MGNRVDLARVRAAMARLEHALDSSEVNPERTARFLAGELDVETTMDAHPVKIPKDLLDKAEALMERLEHHPDLMGWSRVTRTGVVRVALARGLHALEKALDRRDQQVSTD